MKLKIANICNYIFGIGLLMTLVVSCLLFASFVVSYFTGEEAAAALTTFMYKKVLPMTYLISVAVCMIGLLGMYLRGEKTMLISNEQSGKRKN